MYNSLICLNRLFSEQRVIIKILHMNQKVFFSFLFLKVIPIVFLITACASNRMNHFTFSNTELLDEIRIKYPSQFDILVKGSNQNKTLNLMKLASELFSSEDYNLAQRVLREICLEIEELYGTSSEAGEFREKFFKEAEKARSSFYAEKVKYFRGEPFERMMAYYYLGITYLFKGDIENAYAAFKNGQLQDAIAEEQQNQADFPPLEALANWCARVNESVAPLEQHERLLAQMGSSIESEHLEGNILVIIETGKGPSKYQKGKHKQILSFRCNEDHVSDVSFLNYDNTSRSLIKAGNVCWQAMTRGGREVDGILAQKALWKQEWGDRSIKIKEGMNHLEDKRIDKKKEEIEAIDDRTQDRTPIDSSDTQLLSESVWSGSAAAFSRMMQKSITPQADIRTWDELPYHIWISTLNIEEDCLKIEYKKNDQIEKKELPIHRLTSPKPYGIVWHRIND